MLLDTSGKAPYKKHLPNTVSCHKQRCCNQSWSSVTTPGAQQWLALKLILKPFYALAFIAVGFFVSFLFSFLLRVCHVVRSVVRPWTCRLQPQLGSSSENPPWLSGRCSQTVQRLNSEHQCYSVFIVSLFDALWEHDVHLYSSYLDPQQQDAVLGILTRATLDK